MKKVIRLPGLIAFIVLIALFAGGWYLFAGTLAKMTVESTGRSATGLPVTVSDASFSIDPLGFSFSGLRLPDGNDYNRDAVYIEQAFAKVQFWKLLRGKVVVSDLSVYGMVFDQPRSEPWKPLTKSTASGQKQQSEIVAQGKQAVQQKIDAIPTPAEMLEQEKQQLLTLQKAEQLQTVAQQAQKNIEQKLAAVPDQKTLDQYSKEVKTLADTRFKTLEDFENGQKKFEQLQKSIKQDRQDVEASITAVKQGISDLNSAAAELKAAPAEDLDRLAEKYSLGNINIRNISEYLLGSQVTSYVETAKTWYQRLKPFIPDSDDEQAEPERLQGRDIVFPTSNPDPSFWLQHAQLDGAKDTHEFDIQLADFSSHYKAIQRPAKIDIAMTDNRNTGAKAMTINGELVPGTQQYQLHWSGLALKQKQLLANDDLKVALNASDVALAGKVSIVKSVVNLKLSTQFNGATFNTEPQGQLNKQLGQALQHIKQFDLEVTAKGKLDDLKTEIDSSLDEQIGTAITAQLQQQQQALTAELKSKLQQQVNEALAPVSKQQSELGLEQTDLSNMSARLDDLLKQKLEDFSARQKNEAEAKAKAEADKAKQDAADKLKNSLKGLK